MRITKITRLSEKRYYEIMCNFDETIALNNFDKIHEDWFNCFARICRKLEPKILPSTIRALFYNFDMGNWTALHKENTEYAKSSIEDLKNSFAGETDYISDRISWDRLFRTHWLFRQVYSKEMQEMWK